VSLAVAAAILLGCSVDKSAIYPSDGSSIDAPLDARGGAGGRAGAGGVAGTAGVGPISGVAGTAQGGHVGQAGVGETGGAGGETIDAAAAGAGGVAGGGGGATAGAGGTAGRGSAGDMASGGAGDGAGGSVAGSGGADSSVAGSGGGGAGTGGVSPCSVYPTGQTFRPPGETAHCYWFHAPRYAWYDAEYTCESKGGTLATSLSSAENTFLAQFATTSMPTTTTVWIGGSDGRASSENLGAGPFTWVTAEPLTYTNWAPGQPDGSCEGCMGPGTAGCLCEHRIALGVDGKWKDDWEGALHSFICEAIP